MVLESHWFTAVRLTRFAQALRLVPGQAPAMPRATATRRIWAAVGGPFDEVDDLLGVLHATGLVRGLDDSLVRTSLGNKIAKAWGAGDRRPLGLLLVRSGCFHDQARALVELSKVDADGCLTCPLRRAVTLCAQLVGLLAWWPEVVTKPTLRIPAPLVQELNTIFAMLPPALEVPQLLAERKAVGDRAEMYTVQFEKSRVKDPSRIAWVSRESDSLGWDVEDRSEVSPICIEVKGRRDSDQTFFLSENEIRRMNELGPRYRIHFWGQIDLSRIPALEYAALRAEGYPVVLTDFPSLLESGQWQLTPVRWRAALCISDTSLD